MNWAELARNQYLDGMDYQPVYWDLIPLAYPDPDEWLVIPVWPALAGNVCVKEMTTTHLRNVLAWLHRRMNDGLISPQAIHWVEVLQCELDQRN